MTCYPQPHILIIDDDAEIRDLLAHYLAHDGFRVTTRPTGRGVDQLLSEHHFHLILLDLMLPGEDGLSICRRIRANSAVPIIVLTARGDETDRIVGLEMGADDYVSKPFNPRELVARIKAVLWRTQHSYDTPVEGANPDRYRFARWKINFSARTLEDDEGNEIILSSGEFSLLSAFVRNPQRTLSRDQLLELTQGRPLDPFDRSVDIQISRLRKKIEEDAQQPRIIKTVRGVGYTFTPAVESS